MWYIASFLIGFLICFLLIRLGLNNYIKRYESETGQNAKEDRFLKWVLGAMKKANTDN